MTIETIQEALCKEYCEYRRSPDCVLVSVIDFLDLLDDKRLGIDCDVYTCHLTSKATGKPVRVAPTSLFEKGQLILGYDHTPDGNHTSPTRTAGTISSMLV